MKSTIILGTVLYYALVSWGLRMVFPEMDPNSALMMIGIGVLAVGGNVLAGFFCHESFNDSGAPAPFFYATACSICTGFMTAIGFGLAGKAWHCDFWVIGFGAAGFVSGIVASCAVLLLIAILVRMQWLALRFCSLFTSRRG